MNPTMGIKKKEKTRQDADKTRNRGTRSWTRTFTEIKGAFLQEDIRDMRGGGVVGDWDSYDQTASNPTCLVCFDWAPPVCSVLHSICVLLAFTRLITVLFRWGVVYNSWGHLPTGCFTLIQRHSCPWPFPPSASAASLSEGFDIHLFIYNRLNLDKHWHVFVPTSPECSFLSPTSPQSQLAWDGCWLANASLLANTYTVYGRYHTRSICRFRALWSA